MIRNMVVVFAVWISLFSIGAVVPLMPGAVGLLTFRTEAHGDNNSAYTEEIAKWRADREKNLLSDDGWLTLVGLLWMKPGANTIGSDPSNDLVLPAGKAPAHVGSITQENGTLKITVNPGVVVTHGGKPVESLALKTDLEGDPTVLTIGSLSFHCVKRADKYGLRVRDKASPGRAQFKGLNYFRPDPAWRVTAKFEAYDPVRQIPIVNILGMVQDQPSPGAAVFNVDGESYRLDAIGDIKQGLFLIFADSTSGHETYGSGRFIDTEPPAKDGTVIVDFNKAYNPPCAFTKFATCPLPPKQNRLPFAVTAGEKKYAGSAH